jgi:two-component system, chemotaxis family, protein-glutamate methylesterase/glutaminase
VAALESESSPLTTDSLTPGIVAIGISTGGPKALQEILPLSPRELSVLVLIVQHMPPGFTAPFAQRLNDLCSVRVRQASHGETICPGVVYIAPSGIHMTIERCSASRAAICLTSHPENYPHTPSVDVMMESVAVTFRRLAMGVIMTGMGADGALGMKAIRREGGLTVGQDEASCAVYGMPRVCAESGILQRVMPLLEIPRYIVPATRPYMHA